jgi:hypothetical protein
MTKRWWMACVAVLGLAVGGCSAVDPTADCESFCQARISGGCADASTNCQDQCVGVAAEYDALRARLARVGCAGQFDALYACSRSAPACSTDTPCTAENEAIQACVTAYCTANPTSADCMVSP